MPAPDAPAAGSPTPDMPTPGAPTPDMPTPDMPTPDMPTPDAPAPDAPAPDAPAPDAPAPDAPAPDAPACGSDAATTGPPELVICSGCQPRGHRRTRRPLRVLRLGGNRRHRRLADRAVVPHHRLLAHVTIPAPAQRRRDRRHHRQPGRGQEHDHQPGVDGVGDQLREELLACDARGLVGRQLADDLRP